MQIQTIEYGLNDTILIIKKEVICILYSFTYFDINFQTILMPKGILQKIVPWNHSYLKYALEDRDRKYLNINTCLLSKD